MRQTTWETPSKQNDISWVRRQHNDQPDCKQRTMGCMGCWCVAQTRASLNRWTGNIVSSLVKNSTLLMDNMRPCVGLHQQYLRDITGISTSKWQHVCTSKTQQIVDLRTCGPVVRGKAPSGDHEPNLLPLPTT